MFLLEINQVSLIKDATLGFVPSVEQMDEYIKARGTFVPKLKDFRKSQNSKEGWRKNRYKSMKGIKKFHNSTKGKRFHRSLGRFLSTRDTMSGMYKRESYAANTILDLHEALKALSSLRTHLLIEYGYYLPTEDYVDLEILTEEVFPLLSRIEAELLRDGGEVCSEDLDFLLRLVDTEQMFDNESDSDLYAETIRNFGEDEPMSYLNALNDVKCVIQNTKAV